MTASYQKKLRWPYRKDKEEQMRHKLRSYKEKGELSYALDVARASLSWNRVYVAAELENVSLEVSV